MLKLWLAVLVVVLALGTQVEAVSATTEGAVLVTDAGTETRECTEPLDITVGSNASIEKLYYCPDDTSSWTEITGDVTGIPGDARVKAEILYDNVLITDLQAHGGKMRCSLPELLRRASASGEISDGQKKVGTVTANDKEVILVFDAEYLQSQITAGKTTISGDITVEAQFDLDEIIVQNSPSIVVGNTNIQLGFEEDVYAKAAEVDISKEVLSQNVIQNDQGDFLEYKITVSVPQDAAKAPEVKVVDSFTDRTYIQSYVNMNPSIGSVSVDSDTGNLVWSIGDMKPGDQSTLSYQVQLTDTYAVVNGDINFGNQATVYSKNYQRDQAEANYKTSAKVTMSKVAGSFDSVNHTITYTVWVKAEEGNTHRVDHVKIVDSIEDPLNASNTQYLDYLSYDATSFGLYEGGVKNQNGAGDLKLISQEPGSINTARKEFTYYIGSLNPGECKTLVYTVNVGREIFGFQNGNVVINNRAQIYSNDAVPGGNQWYNGYNVNKTIERKMWSRKLAGERVKEGIEIAFKSGDRVYNSDKTLNNTTNKFGVAIGSYRYQVLVNETADVDVSSLVLKDNLGEKLNFTGYLQIQAFSKESVNGIDFPQDDALAIEHFQGKTPTSTAWLEVGGREFTFRPSQLGFANEGQCAYLLTYYTVPVDMKDVIQNVVNNTFTLSGKIVYGTGVNQWYEMSGVSVSVNTTVQCNGELHVEKSDWYYEGPTKGAEAPWDKGTFYWIIKLDGTITSSVQVKDEVVNQQTAPEVIGIYEGVLPSGKTFAQSFENIASFYNDNWKKLGSDEYRYNAQSGIISFDSSKNVSIAAGNSLYVIVKTAPTKLPADDRDAIVYKNSLKISGDQGTTWSEAGEAAQTLYGSDGSFKEFGGVFTYDLSKDQNKLTFISTDGKIDDNPGAILVDKLPGSGTYVAWQIHVNYDGRTSGTAQITEQIPQGMELIYVRYYWLGDDLRSAQKQPTVPLISGMDTNKWEHRSVSAKGIHVVGYDTPLTCNYYYNREQNLARWDVEKLSPGIEKDKNAVEFQVVCKLADDALFAQGGTKTYENTVVVTDTNPGRTVTDTSAVEISKQTLSKNGIKPGSGNIYPFVITVNELGEDLVQGADHITLVDEMSDLLILDVTSLQVVNSKTQEPVSGWIPEIVKTENGQNLLLTLPDNIPLTITYNTRVNAAPNSAPVSFNNKAYWSGAVPTENTIVEVQSFQYSVSATVNASAHPKLKVIKVDQANALNRLDGAMFELREVVVDTSGNIQLVAGAAVGTTQNGEVEFTGVGNMLLKYNTIYQLKETKAPKGYLLDSTPYYFAVVNVNENSEIPEFPNWVILETGSSTHQYIAYNQRAVIKLEKKFFADVQGSISQVHDIPDGAYQFGLFDSTELNEPIQVITIQRQNGQISYRRDDVLVEEPVFLEIDAEKIYYIYELDVNGRPIEEDASYIHSNGTSFKVNYKNGNAVRAAEGQDSFTIHNLILEKNDGADGNVAEPGQSEQDQKSKTPDKTEKSPKLVEVKEAAGEGRKIQTSVAASTGDQARKIEIVFVLVVSFVTFIMIFTRKHRIMKK